MLKVWRSINSLYRCLRNMVRLGTVKAVIDDTIVVQYGSGSESPPIRWLSLAGVFSSWRAPSIGEQVITLNYSAGDDETNCVALVGLYSAMHPAKSLDPRTAHLRWSDVFDATVNDAGELLVKLKKSVVIDAGQSITLSAGESIAISAGSSIGVSTKSYNRTASTASTQGDHTQQGNVAIKGALDVSVSVKTPAIASYSAGAFSMNAGGATISNAHISSCKVNNKAVEGHSHGTPHGESDPF